MNGVNVWKFILLHLKFCEVVNDRGNRRNRAGLKVFAEGDGLALTVH